MKKKQKKIIKRMMKEYRKTVESHAESSIDLPKNSLTPPVGFDDLNFEVVIEQEQDVVFVRISGFEYSTECRSYANYLAKFLPLLLYKTEVYH